MKTTLYAVAVAMLASSALASEVRYGTPEGCLDQVGEENRALITPATMLYEEHEGICSLPSDAFSGAPFTASCEFAGDTWTVPMKIQLQNDEMLVDREGWVRTFKRCEVTPSS